MTSQTKTTWVGQSLTVSDTANVSTDEFKKGIRQAIEQMMSLKTDTGASMRISPKGMIILVPPALYFTALEAVSATVISSTDNVLKGAGVVVPHPDLSSATKWYLLKNDAAIRPLIYQERTPIEFSALMENSDTGFLRDEFLFGIRTRFRLTYGYWQYAVQVTFST